MNTFKADHIKARLIPRPRSIEVTGDAMFRITDNASVILNCPDPAVKEQVGSFFRSVCHAAVRVEQTNTVPALPEEGYELEVTPEKVVITGNSAQSAGYALKTLRQLMESERGVLKSDRKQLPCVVIKDSPALKFRGIHLCWFPETPAWEMEKLLRLAALYKFNYAVLESWGMVRLESHPEFCWEEFAVSKDEIRRLVKLGKELGITVFPQFNLFGHATVSRCGTGKHVLLDRHPEYEPLFEPDGWSWCLSNPAAKKYLTEIVEELLELYDNPPFFHMGCDEAYNAGSCSLCGENFPVKFKEHLVYFHDLLAKHGVRALMWHDMLLCEEDPRWDGYIRCGKKAQQCEELYRELPKDLIISDWQYGCPVDNPDWPTSRFFQQAGFDVLVCPWMSGQGTPSLGAMAEKEKLFGMLQTVWHRGRASHPLNLIFVNGANSSWSAGRELFPGVSREYLNHHLRQITFEMGLKDYTQLGSIHYQINPTPFQD